MTASSERARLCRERQDRGLVVLRMTVDELALIDTLRLAGFLGPDERDPDPAGLAKLLERVIRLWIQPPPV
jgi:hypothetical protein